MEPIYGTNKKYLQSIAGSEYYRNPSTLRPMANEYASYQNTLGRRSTLVGPYTHMSKYSYPTDVSLSSHYGYTSWGLWRDSRNLSSSLYAKKQKNIKSFSILLMSAAFIVVLAVLCVAGLAFYFSTFKADLSETILAFDCTFRVARGDIYTTGLRTNSTPVYRQKTAFYEKLIDTSLERSGLTVSRTEIMNFGDGPTIALSFRVFLDMRKIKITINNVEEHIRTAFLSEVLNPNSAFKTIRIDPDSIEIKRLLDQELLKTALLTRHEPFPSVVKPSGVGGSLEQDQRHVTKKTGVIEKTIHKFTPRVTPAPPTGARVPTDGSKGIVEAESDIDMDNLPVIQGSFEITKTDADITQKRTGGSSTDPAGRVPAVASTLKPFTVSPAQITVRGNERTKVTESIKATVAGTDEKPSTGGHGPVGRFGQTAGGKSKYETATAKIEKMDKHGATTKKIKTTSLKPSTTGGSGAGRRSTTANGMVGRTTTTTRSPTTTTTSTTTTTTSTTITPTLPIRSTSTVSGKTPSPVTGTTTRLTTLRYQVLASQGSSNEPSSMLGSAGSIGAWDEADESDEDLAEESFAEDHLPVVVDVIGLPSETDEDTKNDTLLETIFQAIINDSIPEEFASDRRRIGVLEPDSIPKLDVNLFTSAPILDKQPWHPINPNQQQQVKADQRTGLPARKKVSLAEEILYRNRPSDIESVLAYTENPNGQIYYQSYTNPSFGSSTLGIEPLGVADVRPYPLPVDKIHEEVIPDFKYLTPTAVDASEQLLNLTLDDQKFEHLGDGVIAKKPEQYTPPAGEQITTTERSDTVTLQTPMSGSSGESQSSDETSTEVYSYGPTEDGLDIALSGGMNGTHDDELVDVAMDLESRNSPDDSEQTTTTPGPAITTVTGASELTEDATDQQISTTMQSTTLSSSEEIQHDAEDLLMTSTTTETMSSSSEELTTGSVEVTLTPVHVPSPGQSKRPSATYVEVETLKYTPSTVPPPTTNTLPELFPITKWEFVNGTRRTTAEKPPTKKVFNETLQALVVVNVQPDGTTALPRTPLANIEDLKSNRPNATNLQNLSDIFDTLASKLGIQPEVSSKMPPFSSLSKIKNQYRNAGNRTAGSGVTRPRNPTTTVRPKRKKNRPTVTKTLATSTVGYVPTSAAGPRVRVSSTTELYPETTPMARVIPTVINDEIDDVVPVMLETSSELSSELAVVGQAEVEVIDPNRYEEMLNSMALAHGKLSATTTPSPASTLVTLLPVKSNSGIRNFRPKTKRPPPYGATTGAPAAHNHGDKNESRKMDEAGLKLMNANKTDDDDRPAASTAQHPNERQPPVERAESSVVAQQGSNKNNTMVETVVRASMRFES